MWAGSSQAHHYAEAEHHERESVTAKMLWHPGSKERQGKKLRSWKPRTNTRPQWPTSSNEICPPDVSTTSQWSHQLGSSFQHMHLWGTPYHNSHPVCLAFLTVRGHDLPCFWRHWYFWEILARYFINALPTEWIVPFLNWPLNNLFGNRSCVRMTKIKRSIRVGSWVDRAFIRRGREAELSLRKVGCSQKLNSTQRRGQHQNLPGGQPKLGIPGSRAMRKWISSCLSHTTLGILL
jgi:hypothetical protein